MTWAAEALGEFPFTGEVGVDLATDAEFRAFVQDRTKRGRFLIDVDAMLLAGGYLSDGVTEAIGEIAWGDIPGGTTLLGAATFFFSDGRWNGRPDDTIRPNRMADARVIASADVDRTIPISPERARRGEVSGGVIELANPDGELDHLPTNYSVANRQVRVKFGPARGAYRDFRTVAELYAQNFEATLDVLRIRVQSTATLLDQPLHTRRYTGLGGRGGDPILAEQVIPVLYGECFNISPVLMTRDLYIYQVHDGPIAGVDAVRESGVEFVNDGNFVSYGALSGATVASGHYATCLAEGLVKVGFAGEPAGPITMDVRGDTLSGSYTDKMGAMLYRMATQRARLATSLLDTIGFVNLPGGTCGYYAGQEEQSVGDAFNAMLASINGWFGTRRSRVLRVGYIRPPEGQLASEYLDANDCLDLEEVGTETDARFEQGVTYGRNWTPLGEDDVSEALSTEDRNRLIFPHEIIRRYSPEVRSRDRSAIVGPLIETYFKNSADALEVVTRVMALFRETRRRFRFATGRQGYLMDLGTIVNVTHPRLGLSSGRNFVVVGVRDDARRDRVELTIWG